MRSAGRNPSIQAANCVGDAIHDIPPETAVDEALTLINRNSLKDRLTLPMRIASTHERRSKAHHECGHAMAALEGGAEYIEVRIREDSSGYCLAREIKDPQASITYILAGAFAEIKFRPAAIHDLTNPTCADLLIARALIDRLNASRAWPQTTYRSHAKRAMRSVEEWWPSIQNLALVLSHSGELCDHDIRLFARCSR